MTKIEILIVIVLAILFILIAFISRIISNYRKQFYYYPVGRRCRYYFAEKWIKGTVDWANGSYFYITPDKKKSATDLVHVDNVNPIWF